MAWQAGEAKRRYQARWGRQRRLARARVAYAAGDRSRRVVNALGRASCTPGQKWCSWGQHRVARSRFRVAHRKKDGLQDLCMACQAILNHAAAWLQH